MLSLYYCDKIFSDGPTGKPNVEPTTSSKHTGEQVVLLCNNPVDDGNPDCDGYTRNRVEGNDGIPLPSSQTLEFLRGIPGRKLHLHLCKCFRYFRCIC